MGQRRPAAEDSFADERRHGSHGGSPDRTLLAAVLLVALPM